MIVTEDGRGIGVDYKELVDQLKRFGAYYPITGPMEKEAADAIEILLAERDAAVDALRAQQPPLDRSRWEGCNFCNYELENYPSINACNDDWGDYSVSTYKPSYCPICGRPLTEEAWAEMERKVGGNDGTTD